MDNLFATYKGFGSLPTILEDFKIPEIPELPIYLKVEKLQLPTISTSSLTHTSNSASKNNFSNLKFDEMLKRTGLDQYVQITSGYRDYNIGKAGNKSNHRKKDTNGESMAYDIVPKGGISFSLMLLKIKDNPEMHQYLIKKGYRILDETSPEMLKKTGGTGAHIHLSHNPSSKEGVLYAQLGGIFATYNSLSDYTPITIELNTPAIELINKLERLKELKQSPSILKESLSVKLNPIKEEVSTISNNSLNNPTIKDIANYLKQKGYNEIHAKAIAGNLWQESGGKASIVGKDKHDKSGSFGLALWTLDRRKRLHLKYGDAPTWQQLLDYLDEELHTTENKALLKLLETNDLSSATKVFMNEFERPSTKYANFNKRLQFATTA